MPVEHHRAPMPLASRMAAWARRMTSLVATRSAAACSRGQVRPDGCGMVRHGTRVHRSFLEYDRGTMSARDYAEKWAVYHDYRDSRACELDYDGFPIIPVVTVDSKPEERIARSARAASIGRPARSPSCSPASGGSLAIRRIPAGCLVEFGGRLKFRLGAAGRPRHSGGGSTVDRCVLPLRRSIPRRPSRVRAAT